MRRPPRRRPISVVQRLTAGVTVVAAVALILVGVVLYTAQSAALETRIDHSLTQETAEFRDLTRTGIDPDTAARFGSVDRLLQVFLDQNEPEPEETLFAFTSTGRVIYQGDGGDVLRQKDDFRALVSGLRSRGGTTDAKIGGSHYRVSVLPVSQGKARGAFVVAHNISESRRELNAFMRTYLIVAVCAIVLVGLVAGFIARRLLVPVAKLRATAQSISSGELDRRLEVTGHDDLAELGNSFNAMLDRLQSAFESQRQFLDDAGHELRTPLTILRGHLEVLDPSDVDDVAETRELLLDEIGRMSRLVEDLLLLAKARRDDFIRTENLELPALLRDVVAKAGGLAERNWRLAHVPELWITADRQRLTQALLQLADNAVRHTGPGGTIEFGADPVADCRCVDLWVHNDGPDVPDELRETIFQRFARSDTNELGVGLGLAIVQAIAAAHGGTIRVDAADPDHPGATFRLRIPLGGP